MPFYKLIAEQSYRRLEEKDLKDLKKGSRVVRAKVGEYKGPGHNPRVDINEEWIYVDFKNEAGFYVHSENGTNFCVDKKELTESTKSDGLTITYWIAEERKKGE